MKKNVERVLVVILIGILGWRLSILWKRAAVRSRPAELPLAVQTAPDADLLTPEEIARRQAAQAASVALGWGRDPFIAEEPQAKPEGALTLSGIVYDPSNPQENFCLINGEVVRLGQTVGGCRVLEIRDKTVIVEYQGQQQTLTSR